MSVRLQQVRETDTDFDGVRSVDLITDNGVWRFTKTGMKGLVGDLNRLIGQTASGSLNFSGGVVTNYQGLYMQIKNRGSNHAFTPDGTIILRNSDAAKLVDLVS